MASINSQPRAPATIGAIADAMNIVNTIYGIKTNNQKLAQMEAEAKKQAEQQARLQDPNSQQSMLLRDVMNKQGIQAPDTASAADLSPLMSFAEQAQKGKMQSDLEKQKLAGMLQLTALKPGANRNRQLPPDKVLLVNEGNNIPTMLQDITQTLSSNKDIMGPVVGRLGALNPYNERAQTMDSQVRAASQAFGRYMEGGVLRKEDEDKYRKMFPNLSDTPELADNKLQVVNKILVDKQKSNIKALQDQGFDTAGLDKEFAPGKVPEILKGKKAVNTDLLPTAQAGASAITPDDLDALKFIQANPKDPNAAKISGILKAKGLLK